MIIAAGYRCFLSMAVRGTFDSELLDTIMVYSIYMVMVVDGSREVQKGKRRREM